MPKYTDAWLLQDPGMNPDTGEAEYLLMLPKEGDLIRMLTPQANRALRFESKEAARECAESLRRSHHMTYTPALHRVMEPEPLPWEKKEDD